MSKRFVVLKNRDSPPRYYTGLTSNLAARLTGDNAGECTCTAKYRPWELDVVVEFADERRAVAFAQRHLRQCPARV